MLARKVQREQDERAARSAEQAKRAKQAKIDVELAWIVERIANAERDRDQKPDQAEEIDACIDSLKRRRSFLLT